MTEPNEQWKIEVNDRLCAVVDVLMGLSTGALVLPTLFIRTFLGISESEALGQYLRPSAYIAIASFALTILVGLIFRYTSAKWVKQAWGHPTALSSKSLERVLDWSFWIMVITFFVGVFEFIWFARGGQIT